MFKANNPNPLISSFIQRKGAGVKLYLILYLSLISNLSFALTIEDNVSWYNLDSYLTYKEVGDNNVNFLSDDESEFVRKKILTLHKKRGVYKLNVENNTFNQSFVIESDLPLVNRTKIFIEHNGKLISRTDIAYKNNIFGYPKANITLPKGRSNIYLVESAEFPLMSLGMYRLYTEDNYTSYNHIEKIVVFGLIFLLGVTLLYSVSLSLILRNKVFLFYSYLVSLF